MTYALDCRNPGCCYAAVGIVALGELFDFSWQSRWEAQEGQPRANFHTDASAEALLDLLRSAVISDGDKPDSAVTLTWGTRHLVLDWWRGPDKSFGGQASALAILEAAQAALDDAPWDWHPFQFSAPLGSRFGLDTRSVAKAIDVGFSLAIQNLDSLSYPAVELLSAIGYQAYRPMDGGHVYHLWPWPARTMRDVHRPPHMRPAGWYSQREICPAYQWRWEQNGHSFRVASEAWPMPWDQPSKLYPRLDSLPLDEQRKVLGTADPSALKKAAQAIPRKLRKRMAESEESASDPTESLAEEQPA